MSFGAFESLPNNVYRRHVNGTENNPSQYKYTVNQITYQLVKDGDRYFYKNVSNPTDDNRYYLSAKDSGGISVTTLAGGRKMRQHRRKSSRKMRQHRRKSLRTRRGRSH